MRSLQLCLGKARSTNSSNPQFPLRSQRWFTVGRDILREGDRALLYYKDEKLLLTKPLRRDGKTPTRYGDVSHDSLIGKQNRDIVTTSRTWELRAFLPSLEDYVAMTPRLVTPLYAKDSNLIISLLDLHPSGTLKSPENYPSIEILEAGTGHGALTLHLARAIHAANSPLVETPFAKCVIEGPQLVSEPPSPMAKSESAPSLAAATSDPPNITVEATREGNTEVHHHAVIHTVDISSKYSEHAAKILKGFRHSQYTNDVEFHVGDVSEWIDEQVVQRRNSDASAKDQTFLSHAILDLPSAQTYVEKVSSVLHVNGSLLIFNPNITQIVTCVKEIKKNMLPLQLDRVLELGHATGGREWDVRAVKPRAVTRAENEKKMEAADGDAPEPVKGGCVSSVAEGISNEPTVVDKIEARLKDDAAWEMICRPKVVEKVVGGGFLGVWKKMTR